MRSLPALRAASARHRDALHQGRVVLEPEVVEQRRVGSSRLVVSKLSNSCSAGGGIARRVQRAPVGLGLVPARDRVLRAGRCQRDRRAQHEDGVGQVRRIGEAAAPAGRHGDQPERSGARRAQTSRSPSRMWRLRTWPSSCAITTSISRREKRPSSSVFQRTTCVEGPKPAVNAFAWSVHDDTSWTRTGVPRRARPARGARRRPESCGSASRWAPAARASRATNANSAAIATIVGARGEPPATRPAAGEPDAASDDPTHHRATSAREQRPLRVEPREHVERAEAPVVIPPERREPERQRDEPERDEDHHRRRRSRCRSGRAHRRGCCAAAASARTASAPSEAIVAASQTARRPASSAPPAAMPAPRRAVLVDTGEVQRRDAGARQQPGPDEPGRCSDDERQGLDRERLVVRVAVISDIHGNLHALEAVLTDIAARSAGRDVVSRRRRRLRRPPERVLRARRRARPPLPCGNHDLAVLGALDV